MASRDGGGSSIWDRWARQALIRVGLVLAVVAVIVFVRHQIEAAQSRRVEAPQRVSLLAPLPPPPPPKEELIEQPDLEDSQVEIEQLGPEDDVGPMVDDSLGLDTVGVAGSDAFGLAAKRGGRDLIEAGNGGGRMVQFGQYAALLERSLQQQLSRNEALRQSGYSAVVSVWIAKDGRVERCEMAKSTGDRETDRELRQTLTTMCRISQTPPAEMPQPVTIRVTAHGQS